MSTHDDSSDPELDAGEVTRRIRTAAKNGDIDALGASVAEVARAARKDRKNGGIAGAIATVAIIVGGGAGGIGWRESAVQAERVDVAREEIAGLLTKVEEQSSALAEVRTAAAVQASTQAQLRQAVTDLTIEVRGLRDDLARRGQR